MSGRQCARQRPVSFQSALQRRDGITRTCPTLNRRRCCHCPRTAVQTRRCRWPSGVQLCSGTGVAAQQLSGSFPWIGVDDPSEMQRLQAQHTQSNCRESSTFNWVDLEKLTGAHDTGHALQEKGGLADLWYMDEGDIMSYPVPVPPYLPKVGAERTPQKTEVIHNLDDLDAAPPEWKIDDVRKTGHGLHTNRWEHHTRSCCDPNSPLRTNFWRRQTSSAPCMNEFTCVRTRRRNLLSYVKVLASVVSATSSECTATRSCRRNEPLKSAMRSGKGPLSGSTQDSRRTAWCKPHSAQVSPD